MRVLIADDSRDVRTVLRLVLAQDGHEVVGEATDGRDAIGRAEASQPDYVILDEDMPGLDGMAALPEIHRVAPEARIVLYSANETIDLTAEAQKAGAVGVVDKLQGPLALSALLARSAG